jgi:hypothetical protein
MESRVYPRIEFTSNHGIEERLQDLIDKYWSFSSGKYNFKTNDLQIHYGYTQPQITKVVTEASSAVLVMERCSACADEIKFGLTHRSHGYELLQDELLRLLCGRCRVAFNDKCNTLSASDKINFRLQYYFEVKIWKKLTDEEQELLRRLLKASTYRKILRHAQGPEFDKTWKMFEKFERYGLLHFERNAEGKLTDIRYLPELRHELVGDAYDRENEFSAYLLPRQNRTHGAQPHYTRKIQFDNDVVLQAGIEYMCSMWHNEDGSVLFKLTPVSELQKGDTREGEAVQAGVLIKKAMR